MPNKLLVIAALSLITAPALAGGKNSGQKHEAAGLGSGVVVGAVIGGPVGAVLGGAVGGWFGDRFHREQTARLDSEQRYEKASAEVQDLANSVGSLEQQLQSRAEQIADLETQIQIEERAYRGALQQALNTQIFFRTGEATLQEDSVENLERIVRLIGSFDGFVVHLDGYADARGDESYNEQLSEARAMAVRDALTAAGFPADRITVNALGETFSQADEKDLDALAMERRVHIEIVGSPDERRVARQ